MAFCLRSIFRSLYLVGSTGLYGQVASSKCVLPQEVQRASQREFANWHLVTDKDFTASERRMWARYPDASCPGIIRGHFTGHDESTIAFALLAPARTKEVILLYTPSTKTLLTIVPAARMWLTVLY